MNRFLIAVQRQRDLEHEKSIAELKPMETSPTSKKRVSEQTRQEIIEHHQNTTGSYAETARKFGVSGQFVNRLINGRPI